MKCNICEKELEQHKRVDINEKTPLCMDCYNQVTTHYRKGIETDKELENFVKLKENITKTLLEANLLIRKQSKLTKKPLRNIVKEIVNEEEAYCIKEFKAERNTLSMEGFYKLVWRQLELLKENQELKSVVIGNDDGGEDIDRANKFYVPKSEWLVGILDSY